MIVQRKACARHSVCVRNNDDVRNNDAVHDIACASSCLDASSRNGTRNLHLSDLKRTVYSLIRVSGQICPRNREREFCLSVQCGRLGRGLHFLIDRKTFQDPFGTLAGASQDFWGPSQDPPRIFVFKSHSGASHAPEDPFRSLSGSSRWPPTAAVGRHLQQAWRAHPA